MSDRFTMSSEPTPTTPTVERILRDARLGPIRDLRPEDMKRATNRENGSER